MRKGKGKRILACFLAITLFLTSGFLILFRDTVFGASNKSGDSQPYVDNSKATAATVGVRGKDGTSMYMLTDEGSNLKGKLPKKSYLGWTSDSTGVRIPGTMGEKGTAGNPFVVLEVVPEKSMQELTYFAGTGEDTGLPYEEGYMSATLMDELRKNNSYTTLHFTNGAWTKQNLKNATNKQGYDNFINGLTTQVDKVFGNYLGSNQYRVYKPSVGEKADDPDKLENLIDVYDSKSDDNKVGKYAFNEIYNISITTDDLLQVLPTKMLADLGKNLPSKADRDKEKADHPWVYYELYSINQKYNENGQDKYKYFDYYNEREYTDDLVYFVAAEEGYKMETENGVVHLRKNNGQEITKSVIDNYIVNTLSGVVLNGDKVGNNKNNDKTYHATELVKYNLKDFSQNNDNAPNIGQNITVEDYQAAKAFDYYDIAQSLVYRGEQSHTRTLFEDTNGNLVTKQGNFSNTQGEKWSMDISNYWKVQFRKKYIDTFNKYYNEFKAADDAFKACGGYNNPWNNPLSGNDLTKYNTRNEKLQKLLTAFAPFFESKGVNVKTMYDPANWETNSKTTLSNVRKYQTVKSGGYILAVKPGKGDMYLLDDSEIYRTLGYNYNARTGEVTRPAGVDNPASDDYDPFFDDSKIELGIYEKEDSEATKIQKVKDYVSKCFVFTRDDYDSNVEGSAKKPAAEKRWIYVPSQFSLDGDMTSGKGTDYHNGYLDDNNYTYGFASKSIRNKTDMKMAIYDRYDRRHHGIEESGKNDVNQNAGVDGFNFKQSIDTVIGGGQFNRSIEAYSKKMLYYTNDESAAGISDPYNTEAVFNTYKRNTQITKTDSYHLNVWNEISKAKNNGGWGLQDGGKGVENQTWIDQHDNLINKDGTSWKGNLGSNWLYNNRGQDFITGLCFNFKDMALSDTALANSSSNPDTIVIPHNWGTHPYVQTNPDIYNYYTINGDGTRTNDNGNVSGYDYYSNIYKHPIFLESLKQTTTKRGKIESKRYTDEDAVYQVGGQLENKNGKEVYSVDKDVAVRETVTNFTFTYYGFKTNPILKESLFTFDTRDEMDNFHVRVICVTPDELNQIAAEAKKWNGEYPNAVAPDSSQCVTDAEKQAYKENEANKAEKKKTAEEKAADQWKSKTHKGNTVDTNIRLDLIDRADMFYIHSLIATRKTSGDIARVNSDKIDKAMNFYKEVVKEGKGDDWDESKLISFFENDIEWDQAMKLIKRSSMTTGINVPIMFNLIVGQMCELAIDSNDNTMFNNANDTHQALYGSKAQQYAGNINNVAKLYNILLQFDLHTTKKTLINYAETDPNKQRRVKRTFMQDIFPYLQETEINSNYTTPVDKQRVAGSAKKIGYVAAYTGDVSKFKNPGSKFERVLCQSSDCGSGFKSNTQGLWNRFTFYPYSVDLTGAYKVNVNGKDVLNDDLRMSYIEQGYLESYFKSFYDGVQNMGNGDHNMFDKDMNTVSQSWKYRLGTDGTDYQNVYVLHWPYQPDNLNGNSFLCNMGQDALEQNMFLVISHRIMNYKGAPEPVEIYARARDKVYTLLGRTGDNTDSIMLDYFKDKSMYTAEKLATLIGQEKNVKHSAFNPNTEDEPALITGVYLKRSGTSDTTDNILDQLLDEDNKKAITLTDVSSKTGSKTIENGEGKSTGLLVPGGRTVYFHVPYQLGDFIERYDDNNKLIGGYDEIYIQGIYWEYNVKENTHTTKSFEHTTKIMERELFNLE